MFERRLVVNDSVVSAELDGEAVLLNVATGIYFGLDEVGTLIWKLLEEGFTEKEILERLLEEYDVEHVQLSNDVPEFLGALEAQGLVRAIGA